MDSQPQQQERYYLDLWTRATNKQFLNIQDGLEISRVCISLANYEGQYQEVRAWLEVSELRLITSLVASGRLMVTNFPPTRQVGKFEKFGGSNSTEYATGVESRTLVLEYAPDAKADARDGQFAHIPYRLTITNGPGTRDHNGAVKPAGSGTSVWMRLSEADLLEGLLTVVAYADAYLASNYRRVVDAMAREQQEARDKRAEKKDAKVEASAPPPAIIQPRGVSEELAKRRNPLLHWYAATFGADKAIERINSAFERKGLAKVAGSGDITTEAQVVVMETYKAAWLKSQQAGQ